MTIDWLKDIISSKSKFFKIPREEVNPIPDHLKRSRFTKLILFEKLEHALSRFGLPPTGFTKDRIPSQQWMLEIFRAIDQDD